MKTETRFLNLKRPAGWLGIAGILLLFFFLRWNNYNAPLIRDEGEYAYAAQLLIQGIAPYEHAFIQKPPMIIYTYAAAHLLMPDVFWAPRLLAALFVCLATILLGYIVRLEFGGRAAWAAMWLMTPMVLLPGISQYVANTESFLLLPLLGTFAVYVHGRRHGSNSFHYALAGFLAVTTLCYKYTALPVLAYLFLFWLLELWRARGRKFPWRHFGLMISGALAGVMLELGFFLIHDGGARLWECTIAFNRLYAASETFQFKWFWVWLKIFWTNWWVLFLLPWASLFGPLPRVGFWAGAFACAVLATGCSGYAQYYLVLMPFWALLTAVGIEMLAVKIGEWSGGKPRWMSGALAVIVVGLLMLPDIPWLNCSPERFVRAKTAEAPFVSSLPVAKKIAELSRPDEFIYVAGSEPQILVYAKRFSATRFITAYSMMIPTPAALAYQQEAIGNLTARPPKLIVLAPAPASWLWQTNTPTVFSDYLRDLLVRDYQLVGGGVSDDEGFHWSESLRGDQLAKMDLLLYRRIAP